MLLKALEFSGITFGLALVVAFFVAVIIKVIAIVVQRKKTVPQEPPKS